MLFVYPGTVLSFALDFFLRKIKISYDEFCDKESRTAEHFYVKWDHNFFTPQIMKWKGMLKATKIFPLIAKANHLLYFQATVCLQKNSHPILVLFFKKNSVFS